MPAFTVTSGQLFTANGDSVTSVTLFTNPTLSTSSHYNAGTWTITPSAAIGSGLSNYAITYANASTGLTVVPQALGITGESAQLSKMYDGTTVDPFTATATATLSGTVLSDSTGKVPDQVSLVSGSGTANFADPNVGTHKTVTFSGYALSGADAADYGLSQPTITITAAITPATGVTITASSLSETYGFGGTSARAGHHRLHHFLRTPVRQRLSHRGDPVHQRHPEHLIQLQCRHLDHHPQRGDRLGLPTTHSTILVLPY